MINDARTLDPDTTLKADICIVGAGTAGIALARDLRDSGLSVLVLESGGLEFDAQIQDLYVGGETGVSGLGLVHCRARFFGGTTNLWVGMCRILEEDDFLQRDWIPLSGWPIDYAELKPYYRQALITCEAGALEYDPASIAERLKMPLLPMEDSRVRTVVYQISDPPSNFGSRYRSDLDNSPNITVWLNTNLKEIRLNESRDSVGELYCATFDGRSLRVKADRYVLSMGGVEIPRVMLTSDVGNQNDMVGRCFMEHPHLYGCAYILLKKRTLSSLYFDRHQARTLDETDSAGRPATVQFGLSLSPQVRREKRLTTLAATMEPMTGVDGQTGPVDASQIAALMGALRSKPDKEDLVLCKLDVRAEQRPLRKSRVSLGQTTDALGMPHVVVDWHIADQDYDDVTTSIETIGAELGRAGLGRLWIPRLNDGRFGPSNVDPGCHHMGTTRMSTLPKNGVVDPNCRVHGVRNLYIAGSSLFPTSGFANPVLTLVALAHRLADHLKETG